MYKIIPDMNFAVYTIDGCPYCETIKTVLELTGSKFVVYNLNTHFTKSGFVSEFGEGATFPQVVCDGDKLGGCVDTIKYLKEKNLVKS